MIKAFKQSIYLNRMSFLAWNTIIISYAVWRPKGMLVALALFWIAAIIGCYLEDKFKRRKNDK